VTSLSGRRTQTKYAKLLLWLTFDLNKTQSLNGALRAVFVGEKRGDFIPPWQGGTKTPPELFPLQYGL
jgi:hypothetical protein